MRTAPNGTRVPADASQRERSPDFQQTKRTCDACSLSPPYMRVVDDMTRARLGGGETRVALE